MLTVHDYVMATRTDFEEANLFFGHGTDNALDEAVYLVFATLGIDYDDAAAAQRVISAEEQALLESRKRERIDARVPVAYLVGEAWFGGRRFLADSRALVPRSPIAELLSDGTIPFLEQQPASVLDLCCGGGCIGLTAALEFEGARVDLAELSAEALSLASDNAALHGLSDRVRLLHSDLFERIDTRYELILTNPPYVPEAEVAALPGEYGHEPEMGLLSADEGLDLPLRILRAAADFLLPGGVLILEVGYSAPQLSARLASVPLVWLEFARGGEGVLAITRESLLLYREAFD